MRRARGLGHGALQTSSIATELLPASARLAQRTHTRGPSYRMDRRNGERCCAGKFWRTVERKSERVRRGPPRGGSNLVKVVGFSQTAGAVPIAAAPSVHGLPKRHGWIELAETLPTSHWRAAGSDVGARNRYRALATLRTERTPSPACMNIMHRRAIRASLWNHSSWQPSIPLWYAPQPRASHVLSRLIHSRSLRFAVLDRVLCRIRIDENRGLAACWKPPTVVGDRVPPICAAAVAWSGAESARRAPSVCCTGCGCWRWPCLSASSAA